VRLFPDVASLPLRPPAMLARRLPARPDQRGRIELALGPGLIGKGSAQWADLSVRQEAVAALEEAIQVIRLMWSGQRACACGASSAY
jgi:alkanesulfonate monooxygenase SsuD/methylene tetrahydromethanopterin reductase-like flavin-dependent oxidoreductase (luciferase family)